MQKEHGGRRMKNYIHIDNSKYPEDAILTYDKLKSLTHGFTDYSKVSEVELDLTSIFNDPKCTRIIISDNCYSMEKNFVILDRGEQFFILRPSR
jgi:hypothetical protein